MMETATVWRSYHLHFAGDPFGHEGDEVLNRTVGPKLDHWLAAGRVKQFFFIRYSVDGPHVRLRILPWDAGAAASIEWDVLAMAESGSLDVRPAEYIPETDRYLGPVLLGIGERVFQVSSEFALGVIRNGKVSDRELRRGKAVVAMVIIAHAFLGGREKAITLWERYANRYQRPANGGRERGTAALGAKLLADAPGLVDTITGLVTALEGEEEPPEPYAAFLRKLHGLARECRDNLPSLGRQTGYRYACYVSSQMHMHNNRLGVRPYEETQLANYLSAIYRLLERAAA